MPGRRLNGVRGPAAGDVHGRGAGCGLHRRRRADSEGDNAARDRARSVSGAGCIRWSADFAQKLIDAEGDGARGVQRHARDRRPGRFRWIYRKPCGSGWWPMARTSGAMTATGPGHCQAAGGGARQYACAAARRFTDVLDEALRGRAMRRRTDLGPCSCRWRRQRIFATSIRIPGEQLSRMVFVDNLEQTAVVSLFDVLAQPDDRVRKRSNSVRPRASMSSARRLLRCRNALMLPLQ